MIRGKIVRYAYEKSERAVLVDVSINISPKRIVCLVGRSGVGKTTFVKLLLGLLPFQNTLDKVNFHVDGKVLSPSSARRSGYIGTMSQDRTLIPWLSVKQNLVLPSRLNNHLQAPKKEAVDDALNSVGLALSTLKKLPHELSFGMQQRVAFARAIIYTPKFLFLDEIFNGLDTINADALLLETQTYVHGAETTCVLVTHDIDRALRIADELLFHDIYGHIKPVSLPTSREVVADLFTDDSRKYKGLIEPKYDGS